VGTIKDGVVGSAAFTLPVSYRPPNITAYSTIQGAGVFGYININADGTFIPQNGTNNYWINLIFSLD
jgi:hypothetical protein